MFKGAWQVEKQQVIILIWRNLPKNGECNAFLRP